MRMEPSEEKARTLEQIKAELEHEIEKVVRRYEDRHEGAVELDLTFADAEGSGPSPQDLAADVRQIVEDFHRRPLVGESGVRVHKVAAFDSDADGSIAVRVSYDYAGYEDEE